MNMVKYLISGIICLTILFSMQTTFAEEELLLPEGKNLKEWSIGLPSSVPRSPQAPKSSQNGARDPPKTQF